MKTSARLAVAAAGCLVCRLQAAPEPETPPAPAPPQAEIRALAEHVERQSPPQPTWTTLQRGDALKPSEGVRTQERSSVELGLEDGSRILVNEQSTVFLRRLERTAGGRLQGTLEVAAGQADLEVARSAGAEALLEIEIAIGGARLVPKPGTEPGRVRARRGPNGSAQFMSYGGEAEVTAGGRTVRLRRGWGTSVQATGPAAPPEPLLEATNLWAPAAEASFDHTNPRFSWDKQRGVASYTIEICRDRGCGEMLQRAKGLQVGYWTADDLPLGTLYWRVTPVTSSGLEGYPSAPRAFNVRALWHRPDTAPPK